MALSLTVSCVITSYNDRTALEAAVESVIGQTRTVDEIIIADDASTDGSQALIEALATRHAAIIPVLRPTNLGVSANRQDAFLRARGDCLTWLDGDDRFASDKIERELDAIETTGADVAFSDVRMVRGRGIEERLEMAAFPGTDTRARLRWILFREGPVPTHMLIRRTAFFASGGFDPTLGLFEDWDFKLRLAAASASWIHSGVTGYYYYKTHASLSKAPILRRIRAEMAVVLRNRDLIEQWLSRKDFIAALPAVPLRYGQRMASELHRRLLHL